LSGKLFIQSKKKSVIGKGDPPIESPGSDWNLYFLNSFSERSLDVTGSRTGLRPQWFMPKEYA